MIPNKSYLISLQVKSLQIWTSHFNEVKVRLIAFTSSSVPRLKYKT